MVVATDFQTDLRPEPRVSDPTTLPPRRALGSLIESTQRDRTPDSNLHLSRTPVDVVHLAQVHANPDQPYPTPAYRDSIAAVQLAIAHRLLREAAADPNTMIFAEGFDKKATAEQVKSIGLQAMLADLTVKERAPNGTEIYVFKTDLPPEAASEGIIYNDSEVIAAKREWLAPAISKKTIDGVTKEVVDPEKVATLFANFERKNLGIEKELPASLNDCSEELKRELYLGAPSLLLRLGMIKAIYPTEDSALLKKIYARREALQSAYQKPQDGIFGVELKESFGDLLAKDPEMKRLITVERERTMRTNILGVVNSPEGQNCTRVVVVYGYKHKLENEPDASCLQFTRDETSLRSINGR